VIYKRKPHYFNTNDVIRILLKLSNENRIELTFLLLDLTVKAVHDVINNYLQTGNIFSYLAQIWDLVWEGIFIFGLQFTGDSIWDLLARIGVNRPS